MTWPLVQEFLLWLPLFISFRETWNFECGCGVCQDKTELGSCISAIHCQKCKKGSTAITNARKKERRRERSTYGSYYTKTPPPQQINICVTVTVYS